MLTVGPGLDVSYTVPQRIRPAQAGAGVEIFFRVRRVTGSAVILVRCGEQVVAKFRREHMAPGEMEHIRVPKALLPQGPAHLEVSIEEAAQ